MLCSRWKMLLCPPSKSPTNSRDFLKFSFLGNKNSPFRVEEMCQNSFNLQVFTSDPDFFPWPEKVCSNFQVCSGNPKCDNSMNWKTIQPNLWTHFGPTLFCVLETTVRAKCMSENEWNCRKEVNVFSVPCGCKQTLVGNCLIMASWAIRRATCDSAQIPSRTTEKALLLSMSLHKTNPRSQSRNRRQTQVLVVVNGKWLTAAIKPKPALGPLSPMHLLTCSKQGKGWPHKYTFTTQLSSELACRQTASFNRSGKNKQELAIPPLQLLLMFFKQGTDNENYSPKIKHQFAVWIHVQT